MNRIYGGLKSRPYNQRELVVKECVTHTFSGVPVTSVASGASVQIVQYTPPVDLTDDEFGFSTDEAYAENSGVLADAPELINTHNLTVTYTSSNTEKVTVSEEGVVTVVMQYGKGVPEMITITASFAGNDLYNAKESSYTLEVDLPQYFPEPDPTPEQPTYESVDLGLPSGTLWAKTNVGASSEEDYGDYFSWGNIVGHSSSDGSTFDDSYDFGTSYNGPYASTPGASVSANIASNDADHDAALANLGSGWYMPTSTQLSELYNNTDHQWTSINGVNGYKFMKKSDHSVYVFFPASGLGNDTSLSNRGSYGYCWSSTRYNSNNSYRMYFSSSSIGPQNDASRHLGHPVRAVQDAPAQS